MNILILSPELYPYTGGGVAVHVYYLSKLLANKSKNRVILFSVCPRGIKCESSGALQLNAIYLSPFPFASVSYVLKSLNMFLLVRRKTKANVIHSHTAYPQVMFLAYTMSLISKVPFIVTSHGSDVRVLRNVRILKVLQRFLLRKAYYITCVSKEIKQILVNEYGLQNNKISIIGNGYDTTLVSKRRFAERREKKIVFVGVLRWAKDPTTLIEAFKRISIRHADVKLLIMGDGPLRMKLETQCKELNISDRVTFLGQVSHEKAMETIAGCDVYVLTSIDEGFPTSLVEAMALGKPIVATRVGGVPEIVSDEVSGLLVPPKSPEHVAQAIDRLLNESNLADRLGEVAAERVKEYSWDNIIGKYEQLYAASTVQS